MKKISHKPYKVIVGLSILGLSFCFPYQGIAGNSQKIVKEIFNPSSCRFVPNGNQSRAIEDKKCQVIRYVSRPLSSKGQELRTSVFDTKRDTIIWSDGIKSEVKYLKVVTKYNYAEGKAQFDNSLADFKFFADGGRCFTVKANQNMTCYR